jgi:hypothetical protein
MTMKTALTAVLLLGLAGGAIAGETGTINQAGPYEATMKFYAHPAHGFPGTPEATPAVAVDGENAKSVQSVKPSGPSGNMVAARSRSERPKTRVSANLQFDP